MSHIELKSLIVSKVHVSPLLGNDNRQARMGLPKQTNIAKYSKNRKLGHDKCHVFLQVLVSLQITKFAYLTSSVLTGGQECQ